MSESSKLNPPSDERVEPPQPPQRKRWSKPRVIVSEIADTDKLVHLTEIPVLPTGPS